MLSGHGDTVPRPFESTSALSKTDAGHVEAGIVLSVRAQELMHGRSENRNSARRFVGRRCLPPAFACAFLLLATAVQTPAQVATSAGSPETKPQVPVTADPLRRETPRRAVIGLLTYEARGDFVTAARYLEPVPGTDSDMVQMATELYALRPHFEGDIAAITDDPNGSVEAGFPPGEVRVGVVKVGSATADVLLVRVKHPQFGDIWLLSRETVDKIPQLYALVNSETPSVLDRIMPAALTTRSLLGLSLAQWLAWLLSIPLAMLLAWFVSFVVSAPRRIWRRLRRLPAKTIWQSPVGMPLRSVIAVVIHSVLVYWLRAPLLYRYYYFRLMAALLVGCVAWLVSRIIDRGYDTAVSHTRTQRAGGESILIVMQRLTRVGMLIVAVLAGMALFGINVKTTLAGLGIGGLALALAAQKTFENIFGGISLLMDKAVQVGDFCEIGGKYGTVEDIGLRSLKLRTLDQNLLVVPNGTLAQMQFQNLKARPKLLINESFLLRIETQIEQLKRVLDGIQGFLDEHPSIESGSSRIRVKTFANAAFELELWAYVKTGDWAQFTTIRQGIMLDIARIVENAGAHFAAPTRLTYLSTASEELQPKSKTATSSD